MYIASRSALVSAGQWSQRTNPVTDARTIADKHLKVVMRYAPPEAIEAATVLREIRRVVVQPACSHEEVVVKLE